MHNLGTEAQCYSDASMFHLAGIRSRFLLFLQHKTLAPCSQVQNSPALVN